VTTPDLAAVERAAITIEVDASGGVSFIVSGDEGRARDIAVFVMEKVIGTQRPEDFLGTKEYEVQ
jgi:hypothetical protein